MCFLNPYFFFFATSFDLIANHPDISPTVVKFETLKKANGFSLIDGVEFPLRFDDLVASS